jgi:lipopolysaccharide transport system permease protein
MSNMKDGNEVAGTCEVIKPRDRSLGIDFAELNSYRELLYFLVLRDVKVRYKQATLGAAWIVLQPVLSMIIYSAIFGNFIKAPSPSVPYSLFVMVGIIPWSFFSSTIGDSGNILLQNINLIKKIYFPRILLPVARVLTMLIDFAITSTFLGLFILYYRVPLTWNILLVPVLMFATVSAALGVSMLFSSLNAQYRDFHFIIPYTVQIWMFCSPVIYPSELIPAQYKWIIALNPMAGIIDGYRFALIGCPIQWQSLAYSMVMILLIVIIGLMYFVRVERKLADIV